MELLYPIFKKIWEAEQVPSEWKEGHLIKLPKKGDLSSCSSYKGITLLSIPSKVFSRMLLNRMNDAVDPRLRDHRADFRRGRSCADQIATLCIILEQSCEWNSPLYVNFIDYEKPFDNLDLQSLWKLLRHYGVPEKITNIIRNSCSGMACKLVCGRQLKDAFQVNTRVRQRCLLSTGCWRHLQPWGEMEFSGLIVLSLMTWTSHMTWLSSPIPSDKCKRRPARLRIARAVLAWRSTWGKSKVLRNSSTTPITMEMD